MDITKFIEALTLQYFTTGKAVVPAFWTIGQTKLAVNLTITKGSDDRMQFSIELPATTIHL